MGARGTCNKVIYRGSWYPVTLRDEIYKISVVEDATSHSSAECPDAKSTRGRGRMMLSYRGRRKDPLQRE